MALTSTDRTRSKLAELTSILSEIQRGRVQREYFALLSYALRHARIFGNSIMTKLPEVNIPDMVGEVADLPLRDDEAEWALCYGVFCQKILLSIRSSQSEIKAEEVVRSIVSELGTGGGHETIAGGQVPLVEGTKAELRRLEGSIRKRFLKAVSADKNTGRRLIG